MLGDPSSRASRTNSCRTVFTDSRRQDIKDDGMAAQWREHPTEAMRLADGSP